MILKLGLYLAALGHDIGHTGKTNEYEAKSYSKLALKYNDDSPLERYHAALMFRILMETKLSKVKSEKEKEKEKANRFKKKKKDEIVDDNYGSNPKKYEYFLDGLTKAEFFAMRELMILLILRTDPEYHSIYVDNFTHYKEEAEKKMTAADVCFDIRKLEGGYDKDEKQVF